jgi:hypothetical protein
MRRILAALAASALVGLALAATAQASPAEAPSIDMVSGDGGGSTQGCQSIGKRQPDGGSGGGVSANVFWCFRDGTITYYAPWPDFEGCGCYLGWGWAGYSYVATIGGGQGAGSATFMVVGWYQQWMPLPFIGWSKINDSYPSSTITVDGWGGFS